MKKKYISPEIQAYEVNTTEVVCQSPTRTLLWSDSDIVVDTDEDGVIEAESASYRSNLWH